MDFQSRLESLEEQKSLEDAGDGSKPRRNVGKTIVNHPFYGNGHFKILQKKMSRDISTNGFQTIINHPFGNGLKNLLMVIWGMVYDIVLPT